MRHRLRGEDSDSSKQSGESGDVVDNEGDRTSRTSRSFQNVEEETFREGTGTPPQMLQVEDGRTPPLLERHGSGIGGASDRSAYTTPTRALGFTRGTDECGERSETTRVKVGKEEGGPREEPFMSSSEAEMLEAESPTPAELTGLQASESIFRDQSGRLDECPAGQHFSPGDIPPSKKQKKAHYKSPSSVLDKLDFSDPKDAKPSRHDGSAMKLADSSAEDGVSTWYVKRAITNSPPHFGHQYSVSSASSSSSSEDELAPLTMEYGYRSGKTVSKPSSLSPGADVASAVYLAAADPNNPPQVIRKKGAGSSFLERPRDPVALALEDESVEEFEDNDSQLMDTTDCLDVPADRSVEADSGNVKATPQHNSVVKGKKLAMDESKGSDECFVSESASSSNRRLPSLPILDEHGEIAHGPELEISAAAVPLSDRKIASSTVGSCTRILKRRSGNGEYKLSVTSRPVADAGESVRDEKLRQSPEQVSQTKEKDSAPSLISPPIVSPWSSRQSKPPLSFSSHGKPHPDTAAVPPSGGELAPSVSVEYSDPSDVEREAPEEEETALSSYESPVHHSSAVGGEPPHSNQIQRRAPSSNNAIQRQRRQSATSARKEDKCIETGQNDVPHASLPLFTVDPLRTNGVDGARLIPLASPCKPRREKLMPHFVGNIERDESAATTKETSKQDVDHHSTSSVPRSSRTDEYKRPPKDSTAVSREEDVSESRSDKDVQEDSSHPVSQESIVETPMASRTSMSFSRKRKQPEMARGALIRNDSSTFVHSDFGCFSPAQPTS